MPLDGRSGFHRLFLKSKRKGEKDQEARGETGHARVPCAIMETLFSIATS